MNLLNKLFEPINNWLNGKKLLIGMIGAGITFAGLVVAALADGIQIEADAKVIGAGFSAFMIAIGAGHKLAKIEAAVKGTLGK